jgi:DNA repair protein SbcC/Rad50
VIPERLELVAFGPFVEPQVVDLAAVAAHGLFLIHGPTGSGKSTLLDALTFALFGETSGSERSATDLVASMADGAEARVALEFSHAGTRYRVERTPRQRRRKRRGDGFADVNPTASLHRLGEGGPALLVDGASQVTQAVVELLRCDAGQFRQTVVLPQGQFRRVIEDDDTRARTLADLFATSRFAEVQRRLKLYAAHLRQAVQASLDELSELRTARDAPDAPALARQVDAARGRLDAAEAAALDADGRLHAAIAARSDGHAWADRFTALASAVTELERLAAEAGAVDADRQRLRTDRAARDAEPAVRAWRDAEREAASRRALATAAVAADDAATASATETGMQRAAHEAGRPARDEAQAQVERLAPLAADVARLANVREAATQARAVAAETRARLDDLEHRQREAEAASATADAEIERLEPLAAHLGEARAEAAKTTAALAAHDRLREAERALDATEDPATIDLEVLWRPLARALSTRLAAGAPCPVCGATDHPAPAHDGDGDAARAEAHSVLQATQATGLQLAAARARAAERIAAELRSAGWTADAVPERADLEAALEGLRMRQQEAEHAAQELERQRSTRADARQLLTELLPAVAAARHELEGRREAATRATADHDALLARIQPEHHDPAAFAAALDGARDAVASFDRAAEAWAAASAKAAQDAALATERRAAAEAESATAQVRATTRRSEAAATLREAGFHGAATSLPPATGDASRATDVADVADLVEAAEAQAAAMLDPALRGALERRVREHDDAVSLQTAQRDALAAATAGRTPPDVEALDHAVAEAQAARDAATATRDAARDVHAALGRDLARWKQLEVELGAREGRQRAAQHLADLVNGNARGQTRLDLETYVLRRIFAGVLGHANAHLARMTGGRYQLRLRDRSDELRSRGMELDVEDRHAGGARRRVATLSGGESFQASLALALGLSEAAERTSGAVELGALFIDEGFGSLDAHALDGVVRILRDLPLTQRRMVGVITHVDELKRRIEAQLLVTRDALGSRVDVRQG